MADSSQFHGKNFIGSQLSARGDKHFCAINPKTGFPLSYNYVEATEDELSQACELAQQAFASYKKTSSHQKARFLFQISKEIKEFEEALHTQINLETGFNTKRIQSELDRTLFQFEMFAKHIQTQEHLEISKDLAQPKRLPAPKPDLRKMNIPLGPVAVFGASNFPLAYSTAGGDVASALAAGCPVIVKAHPAHPGTSEIIAKAILKAVKKCELPEGIFSMLHGQSYELSIQLVMHPHIKAVGFTGSQQGGLALQRASNQREAPIPVYSEMGSSNPVFVFPSTLENQGEEFAEKYFKSLTLGAGQFCTNPGLLVLIKSEASQKAMESLSKKITIHSGGDMLSPGLKKGYEEALKTKASQGNVVLAAHSQKNQEYDSSVEACLLKTNGLQFLKTPNLGQEVFGPAALIIECDNFNQMLELSQKLEGQLTSSIWSAELHSKEAELLRDSLIEKAGRIIFNAFPTGVEVCPSMVHGGPYPATTDSRYSAVGTNAIKRFLRPVCFQNFSRQLLPEALQD